MPLRSPSSYSAERPRALVRVHSWVLMGTSSEPCCAVPRLYICCLRLPGRALDPPAHKQPHRVDLRHGQAPDQKRLVQLDDDRRVLRVARWGHHEHSFGQWQAGDEGTSTRRSQGPGRAAAAGRPALRQGPAPGRGGAPVGGIAAEHQRLVPGLGGRGQPGPEAGGASRPAAAADREGAAAGGAGAAQGPARPRLEHRALDPEAGGRRDRNGDRGPVPHRPRLVDPEAAAVELAEAGSAGHRAGRGGDPSLGPRGVAGSKKSASRKRAWIVFEDEAGASLTPVVRRTWAPRGQTPVLRHPFNREKISMAVALAYRWDGRRSRLYFQTREGNYNDATLIEFVRELRRHFRGQQVILLW